MNIDQLRQQYPDENSCRQFFETARWPAVSVYIADTMSPILSAAKVHALIVMNVKNVNASLPSLPKHLFTAPSFHCGSGWRRCI